MRICSSCGQGSADEARFCAACGTRFPDQQESWEARKIVTVLFSDVADSTAIGEQLDPEPLRRLMRRWYQETKGVCEAHGGRVRELIGDGVMAVFGVPVVHEDDALRAVRAAIEMRDGLERLNDELEHDFGLRLRSRTGVNTGEVVVQTPDPTGAIAIGDAINVASRLQHAANPGDVLLGDATHLIVGDAIRAVPVEGLTLKGKSRPLRAFRLLELLPHGDGVGRNFETPLVGRASELGELRAAYDRTVRDRQCTLLTVFGQAGIGKTRLCQELGRLVGDEARVLTGRCLSYGEGITYWPFREMVARAAGDGGVRSLLDPAPDAESVATVIESAVGLSAGAALQEEVFSAARRLVEALAQERPLVLVFEDVHWAEATLLDLVEYLADAVRDVPVAVICVARPELLDHRPGWGGQRVGDASIVLEPLSSGDASLLLDAVPAGAGLDVDARTRITRAAGGNPLFLEQMLAMVAHGGAGVAQMAVPPAIQSLLAARLERLQPEERRTLEHASIEGEAFHVGGILALAGPDGRDAVGARLTSLVRQELIRADPPTLPGEAAFRFRHALIREAAYEGLPKETRSELHEHHAAWLERVLGDGVGDGEEFLGYHLEQAYGYRAEVGPSDGAALALADRARSHLGAAGLRAFRRGDIRAAINLLERACALPSTDGRSRLELAPDLGFALFQAGEFERAERVLGDAITTATALGDEDAEHRASLVRTQLRAVAGWEEIDLREATRQAEASLARLRDSGDDLTLTRAGNVLWFMHQFQGTPRLDLAERTFEHARSAGSRLDESWSLVGIGYSLLDGPTPVAAGVDVCTRLLGVLQRDPFGEATVNSFLAPLRAMQGRFEEATALSIGSRAAIHERVTGTWRAIVDLWSARAAMLAGHLDGAERTARAALEVSTEIADSWYFVLASIDLARAVCERGDPAEALRLLDESEGQPSPPDYEIRCKRPTVRALALVRLGEVARAEAAVREALRSTGETECLNFHADALCVLAEVLRSASRRAEAAAALEQAEHLFERKGNVVSAARVRAELAAA